MVGEHRGQVARRVTRSTIQIHRRREAAPRERERDGETERSREDEGKREREKWNGRDGDGGNAEMQDAKEG